MSSNARLIWLKKRHFCGLQIWPDERKRFHLIAGYSVWLLFSNFLISKAHYSTLMKLWKNPLHIWNPAFCLHACSTWYCDPNKSWATSETYRTMLNSHILLASLSTYQQVNVILIRPCHGYLIHTYKHLEHVITFSSTCSIFFRCAIVLDALLHSII